MHRHDMMVVVGIKLLFRPSPVSLRILGYDAPAKSCLNAISRKTVEDPYRPQSNASSSFVCVGKHLLVILLLLGLEGGLGNTVQITLAGLCDAAATFVLVLLENTDLLKSLHDLAVDGAGGVGVVGRARAAVLGGTVDLAETANTDGLAHVDVAGDGSGADVEPVDVLRRKLLGVTSLDGINPAWNWELSLPLQESGIGVDELVRLDVLD